MAKPRLICPHCRVPMENLGGNDWGCDICGSIFAEVPKDESLNNQKESSQK